MGEEGGGVGVCVGVGYVVLDEGCEDWFEILDVAVVEGVDAQTTLLGGWMLGWLGAPKGGVGFTDREFPLRLPQGFDRFMVFTALVEFLAESPLNGLHFLGRHDCHFDRIVT